MTSPAASQKSNRVKWRGDRPLAAEARQRLIDAGLALLTDGAVDDFKIGRIAERAGVTRPTVYAYFENRDALLCEVLMFAARSAYVKVSRRLEDLDDPHDIPVELVVATLKEFRAHPLLRKLLQGGETDPALSAVFTHPEAISDAVRAIESLAENEGWNEFEAREAAELMSRYAASFLAAPEPRRSEAELREFLQRRLLPALGIHPTEMSD